MNENVNMLVSSILKKEGKKYARVSFTRDEDFAEFLIPDMVLDRVSGFSKEETDKLKIYLIENKKLVMDMAKDVKPMVNWLGIKK